MTMTMARPKIRERSRSNPRSRRWPLFSAAGRPALPRWAAFLLIFGLYLTLRGYHAFDGDQAYRLPLLLHF